MHMVLFASNCLRNKNYPDVMETYLAKIIVSHLFVTVVNFAVGVVKGKLNE